MKQIITAMVMVGALGMLPNPTPADAGIFKLVKCMSESVKSCDRDFEGNSPEMVAIRGWCYMIRTGICMKTE